jgi:hypothetical protein
MRYVTSMFLCREKKNTKSTIKWFLFGMFGTEVFTNIRLRSEEGTNEQDSVPYRKNYLRTRSRTIFFNFTAHVPLPYTHLSLLSFLWVGNATMCRRTDPQSFSHNKVDRRREKTYSGENQS